MHFYSVQFHQTPDIIAEFEYMGLDTKSSEHQNTASFGTGLTALSNPAMPIMHSF